MRCQACDRELTNFEATRKSDVDGSFLDLCNDCLYWILPVVNTTENFELYDPDYDDLDTIIEDEDETADPNSITDSDDPNGS